MKLVTGLDQVHANLAALEALRFASGAAERAAYLGLIKRGTCFLPYPTARGLAFAPSRFIGYAANTLERHRTNNLSDGRRTNLVLNALLGSVPIVDPAIEAAYHRFCAELGFLPSRTGTYGAPRKYWLTETIRDQVDLYAEQALIADPSLGPTQKDQLIKARIGQGVFREKLIAFWKHRCCLTGCAITPVLRASHIKPWRASSNAERLDRYNGLLLAANLDILFDRGFISFSDSGRLLRGSRLSDMQLRALGCDPASMLRVSPRHVPYLAWHREFIFPRARAI